MKHYQFVRAVTVEGVAYAAGDVVAAADLPAGSFASCLRVGHLAEKPAPEPVKAQTQPQTDSKSPRK